MKQSQFEIYQQLKDMANALSFAKLKANRRIQVKMPGLVVDELDKEFPDIDRSTLLTQAALEIIIRKKRNQNPDLEAWVAEEQHDLDRMWEYLDEREGKKS